MDIDTFEAFLKSQKDGFKTFLKGCTDLDRSDMRTALSTHSSKMLFALTTELPIAHRSTSSYFRSHHRSMTETSISPFKSPAVASSVRSSTSPNDKNVFKAPGLKPEFTRRPSMFRANSSNAATPVNTPTKKTSDHKSTKSSHLRKLSGRGMNIGGVGRLFKPATPQGKGHSAGASDSLAGSLNESDTYPKRSLSTKNETPSKIQAPTSPFEIAARNMERTSASKARKNSLVHPESSTSDFEIQVPHRSTVRKVSSAKSQIEKNTTASKKDLGDRMDTEDFDSTYAHDREEQSEDMEQTPSKKQKTGGNGSDDSYATGTD